MPIWREIKTKHVDLSAEHDTVIDLSEDTTSGGAVTVTGIGRPALLLALMISVDAGTIEGADATTLTVTDSLGRTVAELDLGDTSPADKEPVSIAAATTELSDLGDDVAAVRSALVTLADEALERGRVLGFADIANASSAGMLQSQAAVAYEVPGGVVVSKAATDDLWDLSALTDTAADEVKAVLLCLNAAGTASVVEGTAVTASLDAAGKAAALEAVTQPTDATVVGVFYAGNSTDFSAALSAQGEIEHGNPGRSYADPASATYGDPAAEESATMSLTFTFTGGTDQDPTAGTIRVKAIGVDILS